jgi:subtilisin-like proprotein convertase family protein
VDGITGHSLPIPAAYANADLSNSANFLIGQHAWAPATGPLAADFIGDIDEVELFNTAVAPTVIHDIWQSGKTGKCKHCTTPPLHMVGWWPGDGYINDIIGPNNGTFQGGAAAYGAGEVGPGFMLDGVGDSVLVTQTPNTGSEITMDAWINPTSLSVGNGPGRVVFEKGAASTNRVGLKVSATGQLCGYLNSGIFNVCSAPNKILTNRFTHVALVFSDTVNGGFGGIMKLYANGGPPVATLTNVTDTLGVTTAKLVIGDSTTGPDIDDYFYGIIDEVELFDRALSQADIQHIYNAGSAGKCRPTVYTTFANSTAIAIPSGGIAAPYPSNIVVAGQSGNILKVTVKLNSLSHTFPSDIDVLLVGPGGQNAIIMSDVGGGTGVTGVTLTLDDAAASSMGTPLVTGTFQPTNIGTGDTFPAPAPAPSGGSALAVFNGTAPNGTWSLYVVDDSAGDFGSFAGGWELSIATDNGVPTPTPSGTPTPTPTATATATATVAPTPTCNLTEGFDAITTLVPGGWVMQNNSNPMGTAGWFQGDTTVFTSQSGAPDSYIAANFNNTTDTGTISNWLLTPPVTLQNGAQFSFWTRTTTGTFPDRLQVRMSTNGSSSNVGTTATSVGDFTTLLLDLNPTYTTTGYPNVWTNFTVTISGLGGPATGRLAFHYFVESGGPEGVNSDYIGIDAVQYSCDGGLPTPTPPGTPTPTPTATCGPVTISGTVRYCPNLALPPMPGVTMTLTGTSSGTTTTDALGNYTFSSLPCGGTYIVTPTKAALAPGSAGITSVDVLATEKHFLGLGTPLSGCRLTAADVNGDSAVNTVDVIAIQRFFLLRTFGTANVGKYQFTPASRSYAGLTSNQTAQNYDALVFGDVATSFVHRPEGPSQDTAGDSAGEVPATVATLSLPNVAIDASVTNFIAQVTTTAIDAKNKLVGFQGDFTFDERAVTFQSEPVRNAGLTAGDWNVSGNVLPVQPGVGPIRTLRISAYSNDFTPLSGSGTLFELRMTRVSKAAQGTQLLWAAPPDQFIFIDADLNTQKPGYAASGGVTSSGKTPVKPAPRKPTPSPTITPSDGIDANGTEGSDATFAEGEVLFSLLPRTLPRETWQQIPLD